MIETLRSWDEVAFHFVNHGIAIPFLDPLWLGLSGETLWYIVAIFFIAVAVTKKNQKLLVACIACAVAVALADYLCHYHLKFWLARERPCYSQTGYRLLVNTCGGRMGLPSNHASNAMAFAAAASFALTRPWKIVAFALAFFVGISRVFLGVHFPGDVLLGFIVGGTIGAGTAWATERLVRKISTARRKLRDK